MKFNDPVAVHERYRILYYLPSPHLTLLDSVSFLDIQLEIIEYMNIFMAKNPKYEGNAWSIIGPHMISIVNNNHIVWSNP